jgi:hypothetical protein
MGVMRPLLFALAVLVVPGCVYQELTTPHVEAGGMVQAVLGAGQPRTSTGLGDGKDPLGVSGFSPFLTFGLVAGVDDFTGMSAATILAMPSTSVKLTITPATVSRVNVHADGTGCWAQNGVVNLHSDASLNLSGDFAATGNVSDSDPTPCTLSGTLTGIPVDR